MLIKNSQEGRPLTGTKGFTVINQIYLQFIQTLNQQKYKKKNHKMQNQENKFVGDTTALQRTQREVDCKEQKSKLTVGQGVTDRQQLAPLAHICGLCVVVVSKGRQVTVHS